MTDLAAVVPLGVLASRDALPDAKLQRAEQRAELAEAEVRRLYVELDKQQAVNQELVRDLRLQRNIRNEQTLQARVELDRMQETYAKLRVEVAAARMELEAHPLTELKALRTKLTETEELLEQVRKRRDALQLEVVLERERTISARTELAAAIANPRMPPHIQTHILQLQRALSALTLPVVVPAETLTGRDRELADGIGKALSNEKPVEPPPRRSGWSGLEID